MTVLTLVKSWHIRDDNRLSQKHTLQDVEESDYSKRHGLTQVFRRACSVNAVCGRGRTHFKANSIAGYGGTLDIPEVLDSFHCTLHADALVRCDHAVSLLIICSCGNAVRVASPNQDDVALTEHDVMFLRHTPDLGERDFVRIVRGVVDSMCNGVGYIVEKDASRDDATSIVPVCSEGQVSLAP